MSRTSKDFDLDSENNTRKEEADGIVSIKATSVCMAVLCFGLVCSLSYSLTIMAGEKAIRDTEHVNEEGGQAVLKVVRDAMKLRIDEFLLSTARGVRDIAVQRLSMVTTEVDTLSSLITAAQSNATTWDFINGLGPKLYSGQSAFEEHGVIAIGVLTVDSTLKIITNSFAGKLLITNYTAPGEDPGIAIGLSSDDGMNYINGSTLEFRTFPRFVGGNLPLFKYGIDSVNVGQMGWAGLQSVINYFSITLVANVGTIADGTRCYIGVAMDVERLQDILLDAINSIEESARARAFILTPEGKMVATSHGEPYETIGNSLFGGNTLIASNIADSSDEIIRTIGEAAKNNWERFVNASSEVPVNGSTMYVRTQRVRHKNPETEMYTNLNWWVVIAVDDAYISEKVQFLQTDLQHGQATSRDDVWEELDNWKIIVLSVGPFIGLLFVVIIFVLISLVFAPFEQLQEDMNKLGKMQFDDVQEQRDYSLVVEMGDMQHSFQLMMRRLREYKSFVPSSLLVGSELVGGAAAEPPTGPNVSYVFTDIQGSTALWEMCAESMNEAMDTHNRVIRAALNTHEGYEVKTIGDAFMVTFAEALNACQFCLDVQTNLMKQKWPKPLHLDSMKDNAGNVIWKGLRVRVGAHIGESWTEVSPLTGRIDYKGPAVAIAAKAEPLAKGGTLCCTTAFMEAISADLGKLGDPAIADHGTHKLKSIETSVDMVLLSPKALKARLFEDARSQQTAVEMQAIHNAETGTTTTSASEGRDGKKKTAMGLTSAVNTQTASVAVVRPEEVFMKGAMHSAFSKYNIIIKTVAEIAQQTDGVIVSFVGSEIAVAWNTTRAVKIHTLAAVRFASYLTKRKLRVTTGAATGEVTYGNIGTSTSRYPIIYGAACLISSSLSGFSMEAGIKTIIADCTNEGKLARNQTLAPFLRPVDKWLFQDKKIEVYELCTSLVLSAIEGDWREVSMAESVIAPVEEYGSAFRLATDVGDFSSLKALVENYAGDKTLPALVKAVQNRTWRPSYRLVNFNTTVAREPAAVVDRLFGHLPDVPQTEET